MSELPPLPLGDDPFSADEVVEVAGVVATSMHAAAFAITQRAWQTVQLRSLAPDSSSDHQDGSGQAYTRVTSRSLFLAPTEAPWTEGIWKEVCQQLAEDPVLEPERIEAQLALERIRAVRRLEARFSVHGSGLVASAARVESSEPSSTALASPEVSLEEEQAVSDAFADAAPSPDNDRDFIPSELQERILELLDEKALTLDALAEKLDVDRSSLYYPGKLVPHKN